MPPKAKMYLPKAMKTLECHLSWVEDNKIISEIPRSFLATPANFKEYVQSVLDNPSKELVGENDMGEPLADEADGTDPQIDGGFMKFSKLGIQLNLAAMWAYVGNFEEARKYILRSQTCVDLFDGLMDSHKFAVEYCVEALELLMRELEDFMDSQTSGDSPVSPLPLCEDERAPLREKWDEIQNHPECQAVIQFFKIRLATALTMPMEKALEMYQVVVELQPNYFEWHQRIYRMKRRIRRNVTRNKEGELRVPCEEEREACKRAYSLARDNPECIFDVGMLIKESLWTKDVNGWEEEESDYLLCLKLFREALEIATVANRKRFVCKCKIHLGEVLLLGRGSKLNQDEGKRLYEECERDFPRSSLILHKLGKMHHHGASVTKKFKDPELAKSYYLRSIESSTHNFGVLMDYLKLIKVEGCRATMSRCQELYKDILEKFDKAIEVIKLDHQLASLHILKGCIFWIFNPLKENDNREKACESWILVLKDLPDYSSDVYKNIRQPPFYLDRNRPAYVPIPGLLITLKEMRRNENTVRPEEKLGKVISTFIKAFDDSKPTNGPRQNNQQKHTAYKKKPTRQQDTHGLN